MRGGDGARCRPGARLRCGVLRSRLNGFPHELRAVVESDEWREVGLRPDAFQRCDRVLPRD